MSKKWCIYVLMVTSLGTNGCSSLNKTSWKNIGIGAGVGAVVGGALGNANGNGDRDRHTRNGAAIGAVIGGLIGYAAKPKEQLPDNFNGIIIDVPASLRKTLPPPPRISKPVITIQKVEQQKVGNNKVRSESYEWIIKRGCEWEVE